MRTPLKIILVGLPGSGKTTFGKLLAKQLNFAFLDLDQVIEQESGLSIGQIFEQDGEGRFRDLESFYLKKVLDGIEGFVLSTGGGTPCFNENMDLINEKGVSVYLDVSLEEIMRRLGNDTLGKRPMFSGLGQGEATLKLKSLLAERENYYLQSKIKLSGDDISTEHLLSELMGFFKS
ncbi:shikimate kinase [Cecembia lonarensis]|uniref:Shikimate kinase n=1 Tax=Cecembia lonarensis (strain CCUG 58316 / KCTC 22772 / LW9) TaxID=1225176 RepID=K1LZJ5_CECL9|nr:shikimate kinase [Cecembia lonarensis]EKB49534.1 Shikimate kinase [Cecembia lonarensis LW9]